MQDTDLVVDKFGEYQPGATARYGPVTPTRLLDTRNGFTTRHPSDLSYAFPVGSIVAAQLNVTATNTIAGGFLTSFSCTNTLRPLVANVNYGAGETTGNSVLAPAGRGYSCVFPYTTRRRRRRPLRRLDHAALSRDYVCAPWGTRALMGRTTSVDGIRTVADIIRVHGATGPNIPR